MLGNRWCVSFVVSLGFVVGAFFSSYGQVSTTTLLSPLPSGTLATGTVVALTASVNDPSGPVSSGAVEFFDGSIMIGAVPIVRVGTANYIPGTATLRKIFGPGAHTLRATYTGTATEQSSMSSSGAVTVAPGTGTPSPGLAYAGTSYFDQLTELEQVVLTDINNDGVLDLVAPQFDIGNVIVAISLGDPAHPGTFLPPTFITGLTGDSVDAVTCGDLNGDGLTDIITSDTDNNYAALLFQDPAHPETFLSPKYLGPTTGIAQIGDMNHDGVPDVVLLSGNLAPYTTSDVLIIPGDPQNPGSFLAPITAKVNGNDISTITLADMNGDGLMDVVLGHYTAQTVTVLLNDPSHPGQLLPAQSYPAGGAMFDLAIGDMNGDGVPDVVLGGVFSGVIVLLGDSSHPGQFLAPVSYPVSPTPAGGRSLGIAIGDINGDGIPDVVSGNYGNVFDLLLGKGDGTLQAPTPYSTGPTPDGFEAVSMAVGDLDGDGATDVVVGQSAQNSAQIFLHQAVTPTPLITATDMAANQEELQPGQTLTLTIKVSSTTDVPSGTVTLYDSGSTGTYSVIATAQLDGTGTAKYSSSTLTAGDHFFVAHFPGDNIYAPSTSQIVHVGVIARPTVTLGLTAAPNPANLGQSVTFTATITASNSPPTGSVSFLDDGAIIAGNIPIASGSPAVFKTSSLIVGTHTIQAEYSGDTTYGAQSTTTTEVILAPTITTLSASPNPANQGQTVTLKASVTKASGTPAGPVMFLDGAVTIGTANLDLTGTAVMTTATLQPGTHPLTAVFAANATDEGSSSAVVNEVIVAVVASDYSLSVGTPLTIGKSHEGSTQVTATPAGGLTDTISLSCGPLPQYVTCQIAPGEVAIKGASPQNATVTIQTNQAPKSALLKWRDGVLLAGLLPWLLFPMRAVRRKYLRGLIAMILLAIAAGGMIGCGVHFNGFGSGGVSTPPGTYNIVIEGHGTTSGLDRTTTLTLNVTQ